MSRRIEPISRDKNSCFGCFAGILRSYDYPMMAFDAGSSDDFLSLASQKCLHAALVEFMDRKKLRLSGLCVRAVFRTTRRGFDVERPAARLGKWEVSKPVDRARALGSCSSV